MENILLESPLPDRGTTDYTERIQQAFSDVHFTPVEIIEVGNILHGLTIQQSGKERWVAPATVADVRKHIRYKLGAASMAAAINSLCRQAFELVPPIPDNMTLMMGRLTQAEDWEMQLVASGLTTEEESAAIRGVTVNTIHTHRANLRRKRAARSMAGVVLNDHRLKAYAFRHPNYIYPGIQDAWGVG